jgi:hypothetical protein
MPKRKPAIRDEWHVREREYQVRIFALVVKGGFEPREFEFKSARNNLRDVQILRHKNTKEFFEFGATCEYSVPGKGLRLKKNIFPEGGSEWGPDFRLGSMVEPVLTSWLSLLQKWKSSLEHYHSTPNPWRAPMKQPQLAQIRVALEEEDRAFTKDELEELHKHLEAVKDAIAETKEFASDQFNDLKERLDRLEAMGKVLGRRDWITFLMGSVTNLAISSTVSPEVARSTGQMIWIHVQPLFKRLL